jgi:hypothetical protein
MEGLLNLGLASSQALLRTVDALEQAKTKVEDLKNRIMDPVMGLASKVALNELNVKNTSSDEDKEIFKRAQTLSRIADLRKIFSDKTKINEKNKLINLLTCEWEETL